MPLETYFPMWELLMRYGINSQQARQLAINTLRNWDIGDVETILAKVIRPSPEYRLFKSQEVQPSTLPKNPEDMTPFHNWWPTLWERKSYGISPPRSMVELSAKDGTALCCNVNGEWSLRTGGYVALSHVWIKGLQREEKFLGLEKTKITKAFDLLKRAGLESEWIWTDVLVIPGGWPIASLEDELLTVELINSMPSVYDHAEAVLVIDALVVQLHSTDFLDTAIALACGKWATRVWTYQEIKLANKAVVVTATGGVDFGSMIAHLKVLETVDKTKYGKLYFWAGIMGKSADYRLTIRDLVNACTNRSSGQDVDYARAFFPVLGLKWTVGMTREQGMQTIYQSMRSDTTEIACYAGSPRMQLEPGWAPSYLTGLEGRYHQLSWEQRGIRGEWYILKINKLLDTTWPRYGKIGLNLEVECSITPTMQCISCPNEHSSVIEAVKTMIVKGNGYILSPTCFAHPPREFARAVLMAEKAQTESYHGMEVAIHCSAVIGTQGAHDDLKKSLLIRHGNPNVRSDLRNQRWYSWFCEEETSRPSQIPEEGETPLHAAVRAGDIAKMESLIKSEPSLVESYNARGLTPLHIAASRGATEALESLITHAPDINLEFPTKNSTKDTPLTLSATSGQEKSIERLLQHEKIDIDTKNGNGYTALMAASYEGHTEAVLLLLSHGADPNARDLSGSFSGPPLLLAPWRNGSTIETMRQLRISGSPLFLASGRNGCTIEAMELLLEAGAEVNPTFHPWNWTPLLKAADMGNDLGVELLLSYGANLNTMDTAKRTPLWHAIFRARETSVKLLLEAGADVTAVFDEGETAVHLAAGCGNWGILQMILEKDVDLDAETEKGKTALHIAVGKGEGICVKMLLKKGAYVNYVDGAGRTCLDVAVMREDVALESVLRMAGGKTGASMLN